jgi:sulfur carrier protein ThiS
MRVHVSYVGYLSLGGVANGGSVVLEDSTTIEEFLDECGMKKEHQRFVIPSVNGKRRPLSHTLEENDSLFLHLAAGGG